MKKRINTSQITLWGMLIGLFSVATFVPYVGYISIGPVSITILPTIVLVIAIIFSFKESLVAGISFGLFCILKAVISPTSPTDPFFINPLVSFFPRLIFAILASFCFSMIKKSTIGISKKYTLIVLSCPILSVIHSFIVLFPLFFFNKDYFLSNGSSLWIVLLSIFSTNGIIELIINIIVPPLLALALFKALSIQFQKKLGVIIMEKPSKFARLTSRYFEQCLSSLSSLVSFNSVYDENTKDEQNPFGKGVTSALEFLKNLAEKDGFKATINNNMILEIEIGNKGKDVTILAHVDVVPATGEWKGSPFEVLKENDVIFGRGVSDDKGPLLASYYAAKALFEHNLMKNYHVRLLVGGNEECGSRGVEYYFHDLKKPQPTIGFTPDSDFPLVFSEKGIINLDLEGDIDLKEIFFIRGGVAYNAVIDYVELSTSSKNLADFLTKNIKDCKFEDKDGLIEVKIYGISAHGSTPEKGENAATKLLNSLAKYYDGNIRLSKIANKISDLNGQGFDIDFNSETMGRCSFNLGMISFKDNRLKLGINYRYVDGVKIEEIENNIRKNNPLDNVTFLAYSPLLYKDLDSPLVKTLLSSYQEETKDYTSKPLSIGGGTYAKECDNILAFGMQFSGVDTKMHEANECLYLKDLRLGLAIYARAILNLGELTYEDKI